MLMTRLEVEKAALDLLGEDAEIVVETTKYVENYYIKCGRYKRIGRRLVVWDIVTGSILMEFNGYVSTEEKGLKQVLYNYII